MAQASPRDSSFTSVRRYLSRVSSSSAFTGAPRSSVSLHELPEKKRFAMKLQKKTQAHSQWQACSELVALQRASHPFIVRLEQAFQTPLYFALLLELCTGGDVNQLLVRMPDDEGRYSGLPAVQVAKYAGQVLLGLTHLHEKLAIVYRDLKPQNILLTDQDASKADAKLADFGCAAYVRRNASEEETPARRTMAAVGTQGFLAPELVMGDFDSDDEDDVGDGVEPFKTDAYSFGVTLQVMLLGEHTCTLSADPDDPLGATFFVPQLGSEQDNAKRLVEMRSKGRLAADAHDLLTKLVAFKTARRRRLTDPEVREHRFFLGNMRLETLDDLIVWQPVPLEVIVEPPRHLIYN